LRSGLAWQVCDEATLRWEPGRFILRFPDKALRSILFQAELFVGFPEKADQIGAATPITRSWPITIKDENRDLEVSIRTYEPGLTEDNVGHKTWGSAFVLTKRLDHISMLLNLSTPFSSQRVLELGSGTGLAGLAVALKWKCHTVLTDMPAILENLGRGLDLNRQILDDNHCLHLVSLAEIDWSKPPLPELIGGSFTASTGIITTSSDSSRPYLRSIVSMM
jgi:hypothetical protein